MKIECIDINATDNPLKVTSDFTGKTAILGIESELWKEVSKMLWRLREITDSEVNELEDVAYIRD